MELVKMHGLEGVEGMHGGSAKKTISGGRRVDAGAALTSLFTIHFHQDLVEDVNVARKSQRTLAVVTVLRLSFFEQHLEQGMVCVLSFDNKSLHLGSHVNTEATFRCHTAFL